MKMAIIGAGYCGLAAAWYAYQRFPQAEITLFDAKGVGGTGGGIPAALLHPFSGAHAKLNRWGHEGMIATLELIEVAAKYSPQPIIDSSGIVRMALTADQEEDFKLCISKYGNDTSWLEKEQCHLLFPAATKAPALFIKKGVSINCPAYIKGLWTACEKLGAKIEITNLQTLEDLHDFDVRIITTGAAINNLKEASHLPINRVKGQVLELAWPSDIPKLKYPLNSQVYLIMHPDSQTCLAGATFERDFTSGNPDLDAAKKEILPKLAKLMPRIAEAPIVNCLAGIRASTADHLPLLQSLGNNNWVLTGMGSKGLLYHALYAKRLMDMV